MQGAVNDEELGYVFPCNETLPDLNLVIGGYEAVIPGELMNGGMAEGKCTLSCLVYMFAMRAKKPWQTSSYQWLTFFAFYIVCFGNLEPISGGPDVPYAVLGDVFFKTTFIVFEECSDSEARLGFARKGPRE